jgi:hypothetical protein
MLPTLTCVFNFKKVTLMVVKGFHNGHVLM